MPGRVEIDPTNNVMTFADLSSNPHEWARAMDLLYDLVSYHLKPREDGKTRYQVPPSLRQELAKLLLQEYEAFMARHSETAREMSPIPPYLSNFPPEEREKELNDRKRLLEREPLWGQWMKRIWKGNLKTLDEIISAKQ